jgi:hypothetical protein
MPLEPLALVDSREGTTAAGTSSPGIVRCLRAPGPAEWLTADSWQLFVSPAAEKTNDSGALIERFVRASGGAVEARCTPDKEVVIPFSLGEAYVNYTNERWTGDSAQRRLSPGALAAFYRVKHLIPRRAQLAARRALMRWQGLPSFPAWPYDDSVDMLLRFAIRCALAASDQEELWFRWFWPDGACAAAILTHDVESAEGLHNAVRVADMEEERGFRSSFNIVGHWYDIDWGIVDELRQRGFELGVHGVFHDRSLFSSRVEFERQQPMLREAAKRLEACGFHSPATHRVHDWIADLPIAYDCTVPLSDPYEPQPGGCCSPWPFFLGSVIELPYTLPQDHTLFTLLRHPTPRLWEEQVKRLERAHGLVQCLSHPDPGYLGDSVNAACYCQFLDFLRERDSLWFALPRDVAAWWRRRDTVRHEPSPDEVGVARLDDGDIITFVPPTRITAS